MQSLIYFDDLTEGQQYWGSECAADKAEMVDYALLDSFRPGLADKGRGSAPNWRR
jgi:hypothetical protein